MGTWVFWGCVIASCTPWAHASSYVIHGNCDILNLPLEHGVLVPPPYSVCPRKTIALLFPMPSCPRMNFRGLWLAKYKFWKHKEQIVIDKLFVFKLFMWLFSNNTKLSLSLKNRKNFLTHQVFKSTQYDGWANAWILAWYKASAVKNSFSSHICCSVCHHEWYLGRRLRGIKECLKIYSGNNSSSWEIKSIMKGKRTHGYLACKREVSRKLQ